MSEQGITDFTTRLGEDEGLQQELRTAAGVGEDDAITTGALIDFAASKGYEFTVDEVQAAGLSLSDAELEGVTGGAVFVKYDGVDGESMDKGHKAWSDLLSFSQVLSFRGLR